MTSGSVVEELGADLLAERDVLDGLLARLEADDDWHAPTPAPGWSILDQVTHLAYFDQAAELAIRDPAAFARTREAAVADIEAYVEGVAATHRAMPGAEARQWLARAGSSYVAVATACPPGVRVPWYGPDMSVASAVSARLMETWAHGHDVADTLGIPCLPSRRLRHVARLAVNAFANSFHAHALPVPENPVRVELDGPDGERWVFGPDDANEAIRGDALEFCEVATRRRHRDDTALIATGPVATSWLDIAQAYAGPPGPGRRPRNQQEALG